jgi:hypothetical protein
MLPTTDPRKKPTIFTSSLFPNGQQDEPVAAEEPAPVKSRVHLIRRVLIAVASVVLAVAFITWGPSGDFIAGRAFTVSSVTCGAISEAHNALAHVDYDDERGHVYLLQLDSHAARQHSIAEYASLE